MKQGSIYLSGCWRILPMSNIKFLEKFFFIVASVLDIENIAVLKSKCQSKHQQLKYLKNNLYFVKNCIPFGGMFLDIEASIT